MKLPALAVGVAFAAGIALLGPLPAMPEQWLVLAVVAILAGFGLLLRQMEFLSWVLGALAWVFVGAFAASCERAAVPQDSVARLADSGQLDTSEVLRWSGRLRNDPLRLPWGFRYDVELEEVEASGQPRPVRGGLRLTYLALRDNLRVPEALPLLRAGARVEALIRARRPHNFGNPGAFDARAHLERQGVDLTGSLRSAELLLKLGEPPPTLAHRLARLRGRLLDELDQIFAPAPAHAAILRAMLLGDRAFVDHQLAEAFQKMGVYHVLVIAGLHVGALVVFVFWCGRRLRFSPALTAAVTLAVLAAFVALVEDRPPILRAALLAAVFVLSSLLFRHVELLNTVSVAAVLILLARPSALLDPSFQLSFLAAGTIAALGLPWAERTSGPYRRALAHLSDVTRDALHPPRAVQFRLELRSAASWLEARLPQWLAWRASSVVTTAVSGALRVWEVFLISAAIQLGMLPAMAHYFHRVSLLGLVANVPAVLLVGLLVPLGFLTLTLGAVWTALGSALAKPVGSLVAALVASVAWFNRWSWGSYRIPGPPPWLLVAFLAALTLLAVAVRRPIPSRSPRPAGWPWLAALLVAALAICVAVYPFPPRLKPQQLEITVLDVGQGDAIFAAFPDGHTLLVDGGGVPGLSRAGGYQIGMDIGEQVVSPYLWERGLKRLDAVALTHAHQDHLGGLKAVLENFGVPELWVGRDVTTRDYQGLLETAATHGTRLVHYRRGDHFQWDAVTGLVLWPEDTAIPQSGTAASNNDSLVLRLMYGQMGFLLPGDIERPVERELVARGDPLDAAFLKVAHHGSRTSTTAEFATAVRPRAAAISVGEGNPFGHPHRDVLERLRRPGLRLARTDRDGAVTVLSDGSSMRVTTFYQTAAR